MNMKREMRAADAGLIGKAGDFLWKHVTPYLIITNLVLAPFYFGWVRL